MEGVSPDGFDSFTRLKVPCGGRSLARLLSAEVPTPAPAVEQRGMEPEAELAVLVEVLGPSGDGVAPASLSSAVSRPEQGDLDLYGSSRHFEFNWRPRQLLRGTIVDPDVWIGGEHPPWQ
jgi:hypothetical protein